jgi:replicative DNA helicase
MNIKNHKPPISPPLKNATGYLLTALLRYPNQLPDNLHMLHDGRLLHCGADGEAIAEIVAQYQKTGTYSIATIKHATKRDDLTHIAGRDIEPDVMFYADVWVGEYKNWAFGEAIALAQYNLLSSGNASEAEQIFQSALEQFHYEVKEETETDWREDTIRRVEDKLNGVVSDSKTKNAVPGWRDIVPVFEPGDVYVLAGRPGMGKTQAVLKVLQGFEEQGAKGCLWTLEMPGFQLAHRILAAKASVNPRADWSVLPDWKKKVIREHAEAIVKANYDFKESTNLREMTSQARQLHKQGLLDYLMLDYLGLMDTGDPHRDRNDNTRIGDITRALKKLAKELKIPVIELSQLSRKVEERPNKRPMLSDLRDSGSVEQDADVVTFIYRPEYYGILEDGEGQSNVGIAEFIVAKYRNGDPGTGICGFHPVLGFAYTEQEMRGEQQEKIMQMRAHRDTAMPDGSQAQEPVPTASSTARPVNEEDIPF